MIAFSTAILIFICGSLSFAENQKDFVRNANALCLFSKPDPSFGYFCGTSDGIVSAFQPDGILRWERSLRFNRRPYSLSVNRDFSLIAIAAHGAFYILDNSGSTCFQVEREAGEFYGPVWVENDVIIAIDGKRISRLEKSGRVKWSSQIEVPIGLEITEQRDRLYAPTIDSKVACINAENGKRLWEFQGKGWMNGQALIDQQGRVIFSTTSGIVYMLDRNGKIEWSTNLHGVDSLGVSAIGDSQYAIHLQDGTAYLLDANGMVLIRRKIGDHPHIPPVYLDDGQSIAFFMDLHTIDVLTMDGRVVDSIKSKEPIIDFGRLGVNHLWILSKNGSYNQIKAPHQN